MTAMSRQPFAMNCARQIAMISRSARQLGRIAAVSFFTAFAASGTSADSAGATFSQGDKFTEQTGEALYANVCQACHMDQGQGAVGAGRYPALAKDANLEAGGYPVTVVLHGLNAMPPLGDMMSDEQVAAVVNFVRTNFGNDYKDAVTAQDVADTR
jgi:mono/diheme cytochrome c family protein